MQPEDMFYLIANARNELINADCDVEIAKEALTAAKKKRDRLRGEYAELWHEADAFTPPEGWAMTRVS